MIKLIIGLRGSGKTKTLVNMVNTAADASNGDVICIEFGNKLNYDIKPQARLVDSTAYSITTQPPCTVSSPVFLPLTTISRISMWIPF